MKPILNLVTSFAVTAALGAATLFFAQEHKKDDKQDRIPVKKEAAFFKPITYKIDTIYITDEMFDSNLRGVAGGTYKPDTHEITLNYTVPKSYKTNIIKWCNLNNGMHPTFLRHEREHGRKMLMVKRDKNYAPLIRGRLAAMNEIMAPGAEIIEAADHHRTFGERYHPLQMDLYTADSLIQKRMNEIQPYSMYVDYNDQQIADLVLRHATNKFIASVKRGYYKHTINSSIKAPHSSKWQPNTECDWIEAAMFNPQSGDWAPLFKYQTTGGTGIADIWSHASDTEKQRTLNRVDSVINTINPAAKYMIIPEYSKTR